MAGIEVEGLVELQAAANRLQQNIGVEMENALEDSAEMVARTAARRAPKVSGRLAGSIRAQQEGASAVVLVTARKRSRKYPQGFNYPALVERARGYLRGAVAEEITRIDQRNEQVIDKLESDWGAA